MNLESIEIESLERIDSSIASIPANTCLSDTDTWGSCSNSPKLLTSVGIEIGMDELLTKLHKSANTQNLSEIKEPAVPLQKKRGRKPIRPNDPIKKKTEEKDKYWLRGFRGYMKTRYNEINHTLTPDDQNFWLEHLSPKGIPDKGNVFSSYGKRYKNHLFSRSSFVYYFQEWFHELGEIELSKKCRPGSDLWFVFFDYASKELVNYVPVGYSSVDGKESPKSPASPIEIIENPSDEPVDFCMIGMDNDDFIESLLNQI
ncbi:hypothetical protein SteCoe_22743 [Stentor coeruleus]|uniref:Uncharacterized protein n=1 Tax=Stentor coeruleus TaxID=5963 RepID=A0A1R2BLG5_9CILI|nr:hypothetical protein SteCoe_22743 [Stentor coeruleus]